MTDRFNKANINTPPVQALAGDWVVKHSKSKAGKVYYYNTVTGVSTWRKPHLSNEAQKPQLKKKDPKKEVKNVLSHNQQGLRKRQAPVESHSVVDTTPPTPKKQKNNNSSTFSHLSDPEKEIVVGYSAKKREATTTKAVKSDTIESIFPSETKAETNQPSFDRSGSTGGLNPFENQHRKNRPQRIATKRKCKGPTEENVTAGQSHEVECSLASVSKQAEAKLRPHVKATGPQKDLIKPSTSQGICSDINGKPIKEVGKWQKRKNLESFNANDLKYSSVGLPHENDKKTTSSHEQSLADIMSRNKEVPQSTVRNEKLYNVSRISTGATSVLNNVSTALSTPTSIPPKTKYAGLTPAHPVSLGTKPEENKDARDEAKSKSDFSHSVNLLHCHTDHPCNQNNTKRETDSQRNQYIPKNSFQQNISLSNQSHQSQNFSPLNHPSNSNFQQDLSQHRRTNSPCTFSTFTDAQVRESAANFSFTEASLESNLNKTDTQNSQPATTTVGYFHSVNGASIFSESLLGPSGPEADKEPERDIEDMEIDEEGIVINSNLQDLRSQVLDEVPNALTEAVVKAKTTKGPEFCTKSHNVLLVIDTNVFISCLNFLRDVLNSNMPGLGRPTFIVPWVVIQELDYLKNSKGSLNNFSNLTSQRASEAIRFINFRLMAETSNLIGQTPQEAKEKTDIPIECNDDKILHCCLQCGKKYPQSCVVLLTQDVNLLNKATIMGIKAASHKTLWSILKVSKPNFQCDNNNLISKDKTDNQGSFINKDHSLSDNKQTQNKDIKFSNYLDKSGLTSSKNLSANRKPVTDTSALHGNKASHNVQRVGKNAPMSLGSKPPSDAETGDVMNKLESVWKLIFNIKCEVSAIISQGQTAAKFQEALQMVMTLRPLLDQMKEEFERCLSISPVVVFDHEREFTNLASQLNNFFVRACVSDPDPSQPVSALQLIAHFRQSKNRTKLLSGLEQLVTFITDFRDLVPRYS